MFGTPAAFAFNVAREYERNGERYQLLRWAQTAFRDLRVVPPGHGHRPPGQPRVPRDRRRRPRRADGTADRLPRHGRRDRLAHDDGQRPRRARLGRRRHRGRGGAPRPADLHGRCRASSASASRASCRAARRRPTSSSSSPRCSAAFGVVGAFVEFTGDGLASLALADRATIANMSPEFGATSTLFPIDDETLAYLRLTGRTRRARRARRGLRPCAGPVARAGPRPGLRRPAHARPRERRAVRRRPAAAPGSRAAHGASRELPNRTSRTGCAPSPRRGPSRSAPEGGQVEESSAESFPASDPPSYTSATATLERAAPRRRAERDAAPIDDATDYPSVALEVDGERATIRTGSVAIAAITSCTNTSNPTVMVGAGLLARNAVAPRPARPADRQDVARAGLEGGHRRTSRRPG